MNKNNVNIYSKEALKGLSENNRLNKFELRIFNHLALYPNSTRQDIQKGTGISLNSVCGRVRSLMDKEIIVQDGYKINNDTNNKCNCLILVDSICFEDLDKRIQQVKSKKYIKVDYTYASIIYSSLQQVKKNIGEDTVKRLVLEKDVEMLKLLKLESIVNRIK